MISCLCTYTVPGPALTCTLSAPLFLWPNNSSSLPITHTQSHAQTLRSAFSSLVSALVGAGVSLGSCISEQIITPIIITFSKYRFILSGANVRVVYILDWACSVYAYLLLMANHAVRFTLCYGRHNHL